MLFKVTVTTTQEITIERDTYEEAYECANELHIRLRHEKHHGEIVTVSSPRWVDPNQSDI